MSEENKTVREPVIKLGQMITDRIGHKVTAEDPEYWGLAAVITDEMAEIGLKMKVRHPRTMPEMIKLTGKTEEELKPLLDQMSEYGILEFNWENKEHVKQWVLPMFVPGVGEFFMMHPTLPEEKPQLADFFERMTFLPLEKITAMVPPGGSGVGMHVIPVEKAIDATQKSASVEHISHWLDKYDVYSVGACSCRKQQRIRNEGTGDLEGEYCIGVGDMAHYCVETNKGRYCSYDEVIEILERAERHGYVHQITNIDGENKIFAICNCAPGVCNALRTSQLFNTPNMSASAYRAHVDRDKCVACGKCVEICPVGAAKLGQKLCTRHGEVKYPKALLPDATKWGEDKWDWNYKDNAKLNCYDTGTAPCKTSCPAHLAVQGYIKMASEGRYLDALKLIKQDNPFPAVCGAICNRRCEYDCTRGTIDQPLAIDEIKKFIAQQELNSEMRYIPLCENGEGKFYEEKIAVIGAGPSGMSAAYYLRMKGYPVTVFEKEKEPGGMLMYGIPNFRLEKDVIKAEIDVLKAMGIEFVTSTEVGKDVTLQELRDQGYKAFYTAIGAQAGRMAGVEGEDSKGVESGLSFLRKVNAGEKIELKGTAVIIGGGNVAMDVARAALRCGADKVEMACLEDEAHMLAAEDEIAEAKAEGIMINNSLGPKKINAVNGTVTSIEFKKCVSTLDENGRFAPVYDEAVTETMECSCVFEAIGQGVEWGGLLDGAKVELNRNKTAKADQVTLQTSEPDIFVGGDVYTGPKFAIDAIAAGRQAAESIHRFVHKGQSLTLGRDLREFVSLDKDDIHIESFDTAKRQIPGHKTGVAKESFQDLRSVFTEEQVKQEANRCLGCGASVVDVNKCIGCGLCTTRCEFDAIHLERDMPEASVMRTAEDKMKGILPYMVKRQFKIWTNKDKQ